MLFLYKTEVIDIHERLIEEFGGINGLRDEGALESALSSVENRAYYENAEIFLYARQPMPIILLRLMRLLTAISV